MNSAPSTIEQLEAKLIGPERCAGVVEGLRRLEGDIIVLGVAGKMGPSLAAMARRASDLAGVRRRVIGVARFSDSRVEAWLEKHGVETIRCDLLDEYALAKLPEASNVVFMAGMKFGSSGREGTTWAMNAYLPAVVCKQYRTSRIVAFSTGNVYGLVPVTSGGSLETSPLNPMGEYAMSCVARERMFEYFSELYRMEVAIVRINYASELRYGVLLDLAQKVWAGETIDLAMGHFNAIWLGDANTMALLALTHVSSPPTVLNITGREILPVRHVCEEFGKVFGKPPQFAGSESDTALLSNAAKAHQLFGPPQVSTDEMLAWVAQWVKTGQPVLNKPTHFESREGRF